MEKKFSVIINERSGKYTVICQSWTIEEDGSKKVLSPSIQNGIESVEAALEAASTFINNNK